MTMGDNFFHDASKTEEGYDYTIVSQRPEKEECSSHTKGNEKCAPSGPRVIICVLSLLASGLFVGSMAMWCYSLALPQPPPGEFVRGVATIVAVECGSPAPGANITISGDIANFSADTRGDKPPLSRDRVPPKGAEKSGCFLVLQYRVSGRGDLITSKKELTKDIPIVYSASQPENVYLSFC